MTMHKQDSLSQIMGEPLADPKPTVQLVVFNDTVGWQYIKFKKSAEINQLTFAGFYL